MERYECDGKDCGFQGNLEEVERHINDANQNPDGSMKPPEEINCWGAMLVDGQAWVDFKTKGIHPMTTFLDSLGIKIRSITSKYN